jgi:hypothetical protein
MYFTEIGNANVGWIQGYWSRWESNIGCSVNCRILVVEPVYEYLLTKLSPLIFISHRGIL